MATTLPHGLEGPEVNRPTTPGPRRIFLTHYLRYKVKYIKAASTAAAIVLTAISKNELGKSSGSHGSGRPGEERL